ncbi:hypothetical protein B0H11DRAFT_2284662 [Mycena galericulata]|nr:hypothetical protein B0H11DRAFT_2284662 [Mycena galericulata]
MAATAHGLIEQGLQQARAEAGAANRGVECRAGGLQRQLDAQKKLVAQKESALNKAEGEGSLAAAQKREDERARAISDAADAAHDLGEAYGRLRRLADGRSGNENENGGDTRDPVKRDPDVSASGIGESEPQHGNAAVTTSEISNESVKSKREPAASASGLMQKRKADAPASGTSSLTKLVFRKRAKLDSAQEAVSQRRVIKRCFVTESDSDY